jgi:hypothetical protein
MGIVATLLLIAPALLLVGSEELMDDPRTVPTWNELCSSGRGVDLSVAVQVSTQ